MSRRFQRFGEHEEGSPLAIDIAPLIDCVFILLIFFIVTTEFVEETGVEVNKPRAATQQDIEKECILLGVNRGGQVFHAGREIGVEGVRGTVARLLKQEPRAVIIQADQETPTQVTVSVLDEAKLGGSNNVFISTVND
jgi:biopolymer transport protein ExbD